MADLFASRLTCSASSRKYLASSSSELNAFMVFLTGTSPDGEIGGMIAVVAAVHAKRPNVVTMVLRVRVKRVFIMWEERAAGKNLRHG